MIRLANIRAIKSRQQSLQNYKHHFSLSLSPSPFISSLNIHLYPSSLSNSLLFYFSSSLSLSYSTSHLSMSLSKYLSISVDCPCYLLSVSSLSILFMISFDLFLSCQTKETLYANCKCFYSFHKKTYDREKLGNLINE